MKNILNAYKLNKIKTKISCVGASKNVGRTNTKILTLENQLFEPYQKIVLLFLFKWVEILIYSLA